MKRLHLIILAITLLLSQMSMLDHAYSEHAGEVCDYCISAPSLDHALSNTLKTNFSNNATQLLAELAQSSHLISTLRFYTARAPPRLI